jgi:hypothetical protein
MIQRPRSDSFFAALQASSFLERAERGLNRSDPSVRPLGQVTLERLWLPHCVLPKLHGQSIDQPRQLLLAGRLLDEAFLRSVQVFDPIRFKGESVETEFRIERSSLIREEALQVLGFATGNRGCDGCDGDTAVDAKTGKRQPPDAASPLFELLDEDRNEPLERL